MQLTSFLVALTIGALFSWHYSFAIFADRRDDGELLAKVDPISALQRLGDENRVMKQQIKQLQLQLKGYRSEHQKDRMFVSTKENASQGDMQDGQLRPVWITVAHRPRWDMLGSFVLPTIFLYAVAAYHGWALEIFSFQGTAEAESLRNRVSLGPKVDKGWGSGAQDVSNRSGYDPVHLNNVVYTELGFFPDQPNMTKSIKYNSNDWIEVKDPANSQPYRLCREEAEKTSFGNGFVRCRLMFPAETHQIQGYIERNGGIDAFFTSNFRDSIRQRFWAANRHRLQHYNTTLQKDYQVAIHIRRGDVPPSMDDRWVDQRVYGMVANHICKERPNAKIHVFSSGKNSDGGWDELMETIQGTTSPCKDKNVSFHLDEDEFDTWAHFAAADALVLSRSTFGYVMGLISSGDVYLPRGYSHPPLSHWHTFNKETGEITQV